VTAQSGRADARVRLPAEAHLWQAGWAVGVTAGAAAMLAALGGLAASAALGLIAGAVPGLIGFFWRPQDRRRYGLLAIWAIGSSLAATATGGATGPLAGWCAAPILAGALMRALPQGVALSVLALIAVAGLQWAGVGLEPPAGAEGVVLAAVGLLALFAGFAGAVILVWRVVRAQSQALTAEKRWFEGVLAELPYLGAALDREGRPEAVFGLPPQGLDADRLSLGLAEAALPADRPAVQAALCEALDHGSGEACFSPFGAPERRVRLALRRRGDDGLTAVLHDVTEAGGAAVAQVAATEETAVEVTAPGDQASDDERVRALEERLAASEAGRAKAEAIAAARSRFLANMSHELRTPLNAIMGFSDIMKARMFGGLSPKYGEYADLIHDAGRHLMDLINDVLDMSKIEADRYVLDHELFDAREAVNAALRLVRLQADESGVQLRGLLPSETLTVEADKRAMKQIVLNLVSNALKFTPRGGSVTVTVRAREDNLEIVVADTGTGIAPEDLERLGKPFEQAGDAQHRSQGTGLGLSLVKALAGLHGGEMSIESALGEGTAVCVRLPVIRKVAAPPTQRDVELAVGPRTGGQVIPLPLSR
jgi:cell cycle sensor histidine kinase DivJ